MKGKRGTVFPPAKSNKKLYDEGYDRIFGPKKEKNNDAKFPCEKCGTDRGYEYMVCTKCWEGGWENAKELNQ